MSLVAVLAEGPKRALFVPPWVFGATALVGFLVLIFIVTRFDPDR